LQVSPEVIKKQQEDADRAMKEPRRCRRTRQEPKGGTHRGAEGYGEDRVKGCFLEDPSVALEIFVYYESIKREPKIRGINKCRCTTRTRDFFRK
jgi:hypothetical protein